MAYVAVLLVVAHRWDLPAVGLQAGLLLLAAFVIEMVSKALFGVLFRDTLIRQGRRITIRRSVQAAFIGTAVARLIPAGGTLSPGAMAWAVRSEDDRAAGAALRATATSYGGLLLTTGLVVGWRWPLGDRSLSSTGATTVAGVLIVIGTLMLVGGRWLGPIVAVLPRRLRAYLGPTADAGPVTLLEAGLIALRIVLEATVLWIVLRAFDVDLGALQTMLTFGVAKIIAGLPVTPGGLGLTEGGMIGVLGAIGISSQLALAPILVYQIIDYWMTTGIGLVAATRSPRPGVGST